MCPTGTHTRAAVRLCTAGCLPKRQGTASVELMQNKSYALLWSDCLRRATEVSQTAVLCHLLPKDRRICVLGRIVTSRSALGLSLVTEGQKILRSRQDRDVQIGPGAHRPFCPMAIADPALWLGARPCCKPRLVLKWSMPGNESSYLAARPVPRLPNKLTLMRILRLFFQLFWISKLLTPIVL
jgi:hypothetical protein